MQDAPSLKALHAATEEWIGAPDHVVELREDGADGGPPLELDVMFILPTGNPRDDDITTVMTVGLGRYVLPQPDARVELVLEAKGTLGPQDRARTARALGDMVRERLRLGLYLDPGTLLAGVSIHPFARMDHLLLKHWTTTPTHLPGVEPLVLLLRAFPLFASESRLVEVKGELATIPLKTAGAVFEDFDRGPVA